MRQQRCATERSCHLENGYSIIERRSVVISDGNLARTTMVQIATMPHLKRLEFM